MEMPQTEVDGTQRLSHLTFKRTRSGSRTFALSSLRAFIRSAFISNSENEHFLTARSHFTEDKEHSHVSQANDNEYLNRGDQMMSREVV